MAAMPVGLLEHIAESRPRAVRLLGLDIGRKTLGLALSDPAHGIATPLKTIARTRFTRDILALKTVIDDYEVGGYVLGFPLHLDGSEGRRCQSVRDFAANMAAHPEIFGPDPWIAFWDERLSTVSVEGLVDGLVDKKKAKETGLTDKLAAQYILQGALDFIQALL